MKEVDELPPHTALNGNRTELGRPSMALSGLGFVVVGTWYHGVRTAETNSAVVEAHGGDAAVRRTRPAKFTAKVEKR